MTTRKKPLRGSKAKGIVKFTAKNAHVVGIKRDGTLKKGYKYIKGGEIVNIKKAPVKKGLKVPTCVRRNSDGSTTNYSAQNGTNCSYGGRIRVKAITMEPSGKVPMNGARKKATTAQTKARTEFKANAEKARNLVATGKAKTLKSAWAMLKKKVVTKG